MWVSLQLTVPLCRLESELSSLTKMPSVQDGKQAPLGHWTAVEQIHGGGNFITKDCKGGNGGAVQEAYDQATEPDGTSCCELDLSNDEDWETAPLLRTVCGSQNTGGGDGIGYTTSELRCGIK